MINFLRVLQCFTIFISSVEITAAQRRAMPSSSMPVPCRALPCRTVPSCAVLSFLFRRIHSLTQVSYCNTRYAVTSTLKYVSWTYPTALTPRRAQRCSAAVQRSAVPSCRNTHYRTCLDILYPTCNAIARAIEAAIGSVCVETGGRKWVNLLPIHTRPV